MSVAAQAQGDAHLDGFVPWPADFARRYRERGYWAGIGLYTRLAQVAAQHPQRIALVCGERRWTYAEFDRRVRAFAAGLRRIGIVARDRVVLQLPNLAEHYVACYALFRIGALPVFALPAHRRAEIGYFVGHAQARAAIVADRDGGFDYRDLLRELQAEHACLQQAIVVGEAQEFHAFDALYDAPLPTGDPADGPDAGEVAFLQLSGGSTGVPKLIPRTHDDYLYSVRASARICGLDERCVYLCALPAAHNFPMSSPGALGVFDAGGCVVLARRPEAEACFELIQRERVSLTAVVPALALAWLESGARRRYDLSSLDTIQIGGAHLAGDVARRVPEAFGCRLQQVFGMAEGLVNYTRDDDPAELALTSQGRPISEDDEIRIVDDEDVDVAEGEIGHLLTRGPYTIRGYYRAQAHNARAFTADGFYRTGDRVRRLPSGHLVVEGRAKDLVNRGGEKIAAEEVESHLLAHPAVFDAALVAMPDRWLGEKSCAFVVLREPAPAPRELQRFVRERGVAAYKVPDRIEVLAQLPRTAVGKIDKKALRARFEPADASSTAASAAGSISTAPIPTAPVSTAPTSATSISATADPT
ncbi:(2,3-dihydroxybenzoyl)adenylate synthase [Lysobacter sp. BMK333-48F3]|uniref:(2,3-dihydroxybenzoyl)adenylate synthase n=1 Tax=Lysobacter sp. BMK333-48F3 TaxID=2867962 RepID=UPI001C8B180E|nr:(2,3-dihydroxybenzoyl)adenylate synthase [Lysobacter sp. BMK333-48F3]MBX9403242.1 (2,3-dihydroxybenzoyl)adenylate synthase [Lysobacter sp. BMK333-48F3]